MPKILAYPPSRNPYQGLLYDALTSAHPEARVSYCEPIHRLGVLGLPAQLLVARLRGYRILHIHWPVFRVPRWVPFRRGLEVWAPGAVLRLARSLGYEIVWTVHEVVPHEPRTADDVTVARDLAGAAAALIVHSPTTISAMRQSGLPADHARIIPHGHFIGVYGDPLEKQEARALLGIPRGAFVILAFGNLRPYKGLEQLIQVVQASADASLRLVIAGRALQPAHSAGVRAVVTDDRVILREGWVSDEEVPALFGACDVVAAPFRAVTTSGSAVLALSFGRPLVAPRIGNLVDLPEGVGFFYDPDDPDGLATSLHRARTSEHLDEMGKAALTCAETLAWSAIAEETWHVYERALTAGC